MVMTTREEIVTEVRTWKDTKFVHQASVKGVGCDCAGLILGVGVNTGGIIMKLTDAALQEFVGYSTRPDPHKMIRALGLLMLPIRKEEAGAGDVVYRRYTMEPQHLGILTGDLFEAKSGVVHAERWPARKVVEGRTDGDWYNNVTSAWRYPGLVT